MQGIQRNSVAFHRRCAGAVPFYVRGLQSDFYVSNAEIPTGYGTPIFISPNYSWPKIGLTHEALLGCEIVRHVMESKTYSRANVGVQSLREMRCYQFARKAWNVRRLLPKCRCDVWSEVSASGTIYQSARCRWRYRFGDPSTRGIFDFPDAIVLKTPKRIENVDGTRRRPEFEQQLF